MQEFEALLVVGVSFLGVIGSVAYYFARFYFNAGQEDPHSATELKELDKAEESMATTQPEAEQQVVSKPELELVQKNSARSRKSRACSRKGRTFSRKSRARSRKVETVQKSRARSRKKFVQEK